MAEYANFGTPEDFGEAGLWSGIGTVVKSRAVRYRYSNGNETAGCAWLIKPKDGGPAVSQIYSAGSPEDWAAVEGDSNEEKIQFNKGEVKIQGIRLKRVGSQDTITNQTNFYHLMESLFEAGFKKMEGLNDYSSFDGLEASFLRKPQKVREGLDQKEREDSQGRKFKPTILLVNEILTMPGESKAKGRKRRSAAKGKAKGKAQAAPEATWEEALDVVEAVLDDAEGSLPMIQVMGQSFQKAKDTVPGRENAVITLMAKADEFRSQLEEDGRFELDGDDLSLAE